MQVHHQSRSLQYRQPFGAVPIHTNVRLAVQVKPEQDVVKAVFLCYAYGLYTFRESRLRLTGTFLENPSGQNTNRKYGLVTEASCQAARLTEPALTDLDAAAIAAAADADLTRDVPDGIPDEIAEGPEYLYAGECPMPSEPCLFFYWFEIQTVSGRFFYTSNNDGSDGSGWLGPNRPRYLPGEPHLPVAFQITVYLDTFTVPDWLIGGVMYQIFPDRFKRDRQFSLNRFAKPENDLPERIFHTEWDEEVDYIGKPETGYLACDFFGGSINGIREKLGYLANLGINILYLNPIFRARSNHRYDTGDYEKIDPLLGTNEDLENLCLEARALGIRIILDGVFSHTGADSRYFNKFGRYDELGAFQEIQGDGYSDYGSWYTFHIRGDEVFYDSWWGFPDLPSVNEHDLTYRHYLTGPQGIIRYWLRHGISGWRLDVSDELPDSFLREVRKTIRQENPQAALMGEVWENASHKISYGSYRDFLFGRTHDNIMGYPFQQALVGWLGKHVSAQHTANQLETLREQYPTVSFYSSMNLISSHDIPRAITALAGLSDPGNREAQSNMHLSAAARQRGIALLRLAWLFQIAFPGIATIYYGDETAVEGYRDPFNRRTFPWGEENVSLLTWFARLGKLRNRLSVLRTGYFQLLLAEDDVIIFERTLVDGHDIFGQPQDGPDRVIVALNRHHAPITIELDGRMIILPAFGGLLEFDKEQIMTGENKLQKG